MRDAVYVDSTPHLHVGDPAFEDWFQQHPRACESGIKQTARDPLVVARSSVPPPKTMPDPDWKGDVDEATYKSGWNDCVAEALRLGLTPATFRLHGTVICGSVVDDADVLRRAKYHVYPAMGDDPEDWELFEPNTNCDDCIPVLIVRADALTVLPGEPQ